MVDGAAGSTSDLEDDPRGLHERQCLFTRCLAKLIIYAEARGYELTLAEIGVQYDRKARSGQVYADGVHMIASLHYSRLAADLNLWDGGDWITDSGAYQWTDLGVFWESLDSLAAWGGRFSKPDGNHVSIRWQGRA